MNILRKLTNEHLSTFPDRNVLVAIGEVGLASSVNPGIQDGV